MSTADDRSAKALEDIARSLKHLTRIFIEIEKHLAPTSIAVTPTQVTNGPKTMPDAFDQPQEPQPGKDEPPKPTFPKSDNPYFQQRKPLDDNGPQRDFAPGA